MKVTLTNFEVDALANMLSAPESILNNKDKFLSVKFLWTLDSNATKIFEIAKKIGEMRQNINNDFLDDKYSIEDEEGNRRVRDEYMGEYTQKVNELLVIENEFNFKPIYIEDIEKYEITGNDYQCIKVMLQSKKDNVEEA